MIFDTENNRVILYGGNTEGETRQFYDDTWIFSPTDNTWTQLIIDGPDPRGGHAMAYNPDKGTVLLFGGRTSTRRLDDTWIFDCRTEIWTEIETETNPEGRSDSDIAYDSIRKIFILYGGWGDRSGLQSDTWVFDPESNTWSEYETVNNPGTMYGQSLEFDPVGERVILYGGHIRSPVSREYVDEVWFFYPDNSSWVQSNCLNKPHGRYWNAASYITEYSLLLVFGGSYGGGSLNETWVLNTDKVSWTLLDSPYFPSRRVIPDMVYIDSQRCFILFGGVNNSYTHFGDTWKLDAETWTWNQIEATYSSREAIKIREQGIIPGYPILALITGIGLVVLTRKKSQFKL